MGELMYAHFHARKMGSAEDIHLYETGDTRICEICEHYKAESEKMQDALHEIETIKTEEEEKLEEERFGEEIGLPETGEEKDMGLDYIDDMRDRKKRRLTHKKRLLAVHAKRKSIKKIGHRRLRVRRLRKRLKRKVVHHLTHHARKTG